MLTCCWSTGSQDQREPDTAPGKEEQAADDTQLDSEEEGQGEAGTSMEYQEPVEQVRQRVVFLAP